MSSIDYVSNQYNQYKPGHTHLAQRGVLHRNLAQEEVDVVTVVDGVQEVRLCREGEEKKKERKMKKEGKKK